MLVCLVLWVEEKQGITVWKSLRSASERLQPHCWICDNKRWHGGALRPHAGVYPSRKCTRDSPKFYVLTFHNKITRSSSVCHAAAPLNPRVVLLERPAVQSPLWCTAGWQVWRPHHPEGRLSRHWKQTLQKYVTPNRRCRARGARRGEVTRATTVLHLLVCEHLYKISVAQMWSYFRREGEEP